jgi:dTDP-4-amino-4,6-dideoxygalactose transaminase
VIPCSNPHAQYISHKAEIDGAVARVLSKGRYILGEEVEAFEKEFATYIGVHFGIGVANGTDALHIALRACEIGPGDEVITVSHSAVATVAAIELAGAKAVLVDIEPRTFTMDVEQIEPNITSRTRAIIPVHIYGHPARLDKIVEIAHKRNLFVIEDCAQAHGAAFQGRRVGSWGHIACFSFYPTKNLGAIGDGGMVVTNDETLARQLRRLREYGWETRNMSEIPGLNSRLDEIQAALLRVKLSFLDQDNKSRRALAARYLQALQGTGCILPIEQEGAQHVYHLYVIRVPERDRIREKMLEREVQCLVHYPHPIHLQRAYKNRVAVAGRLQETEKASSEVLSLPMYPQLTEREVERVGETLKEIV